jgi:predicted ATPase
LEWIEIHDLRGWGGQRINFSFPIIAIVGENGSGKSTILQAAACVYKSPTPKDTLFASSFFPDTAWDKVENVDIKYGYKEGNLNREDLSVRKRTTKWLGNRNRPIRPVEYIDLSRIQPVGARTGYTKIAKTKHSEVSSTAFDPQQVQHFSFVMGKNYDGARMAISSLDKKREIPVLSKANIVYSGFHQGSGETTIAEFLQAEFPKYGLILIDEIESSLHPRAQRRLIRYLADKCRDREVQIVLTTHSPYVLDELPMDSRIYILETDHEKEIITGVSPQFAMTKMDDESHPECDLYVEDIAAKTLLDETLSYHGKDIYLRCESIPFGTSHVGCALGLMASAKRFKRPTCVFLDGDNEVSPGCILLPGKDAPERVVFNDLSKIKYGNVWMKIQRDISSVMDSCNAAMALADHHEWTQFVANRLGCSALSLWQAMCSDWAKQLPKHEADKLINPIRDILPS